MTLERRKILNAFGAKIIFSQGSKGRDGAENLPRKIVMQNPNKYFMSYQFTNTSNILTHYETTAEEIWKDTRGKITHFIAGIGTTGTLMEYQKD